MSNNIVSTFCCVEEFEKHAFTLLPRNALDYYRSGSYEQRTVQNNKEAFRRLRIRPKVLMDITKRSTEVEVLGYKINAPVAVAPSAMQKMAHPDGESANARAAGSVGTIYILSTLSTTSIEDVAKAAPNTIKWFQLYVYKDRNVTRELVRRAENAGFKALVLTVDTNVFGSRWSDMKNNFQLPSHLTLGNFNDEGKMKLENETGETNSGLATYIISLFDGSISWKDVIWLKSITKLPLVLKGILTAEDAIKAADMGIPAIIVSNHGGRQLDTAPASIEALPEISKAVGNRIEIYFDGGIRLGSDIFKALALGAKMVFVGRPVLWGLACNGQDGAQKVLKILIEELSQTLGLTGCTSVSDINRSMIVHETYYHKL